MRNGLRRAMFGVAVAWAAWVAWAGVLGGVCRGAAPHASGPASAPSRVVADIEYAVVDGEHLKLDVHSPAEGKRPFPVVVLVHGGGWGSGDKARDITPVFEPLARGGFLVFSINYRLAPKYRWPACFEDVRTAIAWVRAHAAEYGGDPKRLALMGHSAGGQLVCLAAAMSLPGEQVQAVVGLAPVTDFEQDLPQRGGLSKALQDLLDRPKEVTEESRKVLRELSPINHVKAGLPPFLIVQGEADKTVPLQQSLNFQAKLKASGDRCDLVTVKGAPHNLLKWDALDGSYREKMVGWLQDVLKAK